MWGQEQDLPFVPTTDPSAPHYYLIQSFVNTGYYMRPNGTKVNTLNIITDDMKWYFLKAGDPVDGVQYYYICDKNNRYMYFSGPNFVGTGANQRIWVELHQSVTSGSEDKYKFTIEKKNSQEWDSYNIIPKGTTNKSCLNKQGGNAGGKVSNAKLGDIQVYAGYDDQSSNWNFIDVNDYEWTLLPECFTVSKEETPHYYKIQNKNFPTYYIKPDATNVTNVITSNSTSENDMAWYFKEVGSNGFMKYYYIIHAVTGNYLCYGGGTAESTFSSPVLAEHTGSETDENRFRFIVVRGTNADETITANKGITFNIVPLLLENTFTNYKYYCLSSTQDAGSNLAIENKRSDNMAHWNFVSTGAWADPEITCDATGTVTITREDGAEVYYTTNGDTPTATESATNKKYNAPFTVNPGKTTINARVIKPGKDNSNVVTKTIVYNPTITLTADSYTYTGSAQNPVSSVDYVDAENSENNIHFETTQYTISYKKGDDVVTDCIDAGEYTIILNDVDGGDYIVCGTDNFSIDKATPEVTAPTANSLIYSGVAQELITAGSSTAGTIQYALSEGGTYSSDIPTGIAAGAYTVYYKVVGNDNYNDVDEAGPVNVTISPKTVKDDPDTSAGEAAINIVLSEPEGGFVYDGNAKTPTVTVKDGETVISAEEYTVAITDNVNSGTNTATVTITDKDGGNYIVSGTTTFSINKATLTVTANNKSITYGDEPANAGVTYTGFIERENENTEGMFTTALSYAYNSAADGSGNAYTTTSNVGSYFIIPSGLTAANYNITFENGTLTVDQKEVGIEWSNTSLPYNRLEQKPTATATGLVNNDEIGVTVEGAQTDIGTGYTATATGLTGTGGKEGNYKLPTPNPSTTFEITTAVLIVTANDKAIIFDDEPSNSGVTYSGFIVGQDENTEGILSGTLSYSYKTEEDGSGTAYSAGSNAGTYYIIPSGLTSTSYEVRFVAGTLTVNPKVVKDNPDTSAGEAAITIVLSDIPEGGFIYDGSEKTPTVTVKDGDTDTVIPGGDNGEYTLEITGNVNAGTNTATVTITDKNGGNYTVSGTTTFSINKATLTATADDVDIIYGDEAPATYAISYTGFVNDEDENVITTAPTATCTYTQGDDAGEYDITVSDDGVAENYEFAVVNGTLTVGPKTVSDPTIEISETSVEYDGAEKKPDVTMVKDGETEIPSAQYQWSWSNNINAAESTDENPPTVTVTNIENGNYTISGTVTFTITPKSIGNGTASAEGFVISFDDSENVTITCPIENLTKDIDFTVDGPTEEDGIQMWTIAGIGNYSGGAKVMRIALNFYDTGADTGENVQDVGTFQASSDMVISGKDVYIVTDVNLTKNQVVLSKIAYAPKDVPVLLLTDLEGDDTETTTNAAAFPIEVAEGDEADTSGNILKKVSGAGGLQVTFGKVFMFYLGKFVLTTEGTLEAGSFYFDNPNPPSSSTAGARLSIVIDEKTDIDGIKEYDNTGTAIDRWYSLDGRRLNGKPTKKGLYIKNGQKVVVK